MYRKYSRAGIWPRTCPITITWLPTSLEGLSRTGFIRTSVSTPAQAAGLAALKETAYVQAVRALIADQRPRLAAGLAALGCQVLPGEANYLLFRCGTPLAEPLRRRGILLRSCANYQGLGPDWYRTAVRTGPENRRLLAALREVLG